MLDGVRAETAARDGNGGRREEAPAAAVCRGVAEQAGSDRGVVDVEPERDPCRVLGECRGQRIRAQAGERRARGVLGPRRPGVLEKRAGQGERVRSAAGEIAGAGTTPVRAAVLRRVGNERVVS
jgi:hypothetical protein